jgi:hypothetical protein
MAHHARRAALIVVNQENASLKQCSVVLIAADLRKHRANVAVIGV